MNPPPLVKILRPALAPTAAADVLAAAAFAGGADPWKLACAVAGSVCLYVGGMAQNDLCDRAVDATKQPDRPLVVQPELVRPARLMTLGLFAAGIGLGAAVGAIWPALAVAILASAYNLGLKRFFPFDGLTIGAARAANLTIGFTVAGAGVWTAAPYCGLYLLLVAAISAASRAEDREPRQTRQLILMLAVLPKLLAMLGLALLTGGGRALGFLLPAAMQLQALVPAMRAGDRGAAKLYTLRSLLNLFAVHAAVLWAVRAHGGLIGVLTCAAASYLLIALLAPRTPANVT